KNPDLPKVKNYDEGDNEGLKIALFDGIFKEGTLKELQKYSSFDEVWNNFDLYQIILSEFKEWYIKQNEEISEYLKGINFVDSNIQKRFGGISNLKNRLIETYIANYNIHQIETINLFHGDLSQFKTFDKRS